MRRISWILAFLLALAAPSAAQAPSAGPRWDTSLNAGVIEAKPDQVNEPYYDSWYAQGRYSGSVGYYFTKHLKAEFEHAWSGEGSRLLLQYQRLGGAPYPYQVEQLFQLQQSTLRVVWQFRDNAWVHPYVSAGAVLDIEHQRVHVPTVYQQGSRGDLVLVHNEMTSDRGYELRPGFSIGGGAKFYVNGRAFVNTGVLATHSSPAGSTVSFIAGFGIDF